VIVVDASAWANALADPGPTGEGCRAALHMDVSWTIPSHGATEVLRTLRRLEFAGILIPAEAQRLADTVASAEVNYIGPSPTQLAGQWKLRHNLSAYDAAYVVLAQRFDAPLLTTDGRLAGAATALGVEVRLVPVQG
jgi:predicted nucleic acid-binding protein